MFNPFDVFNPNMSHQKSGDRVAIGCGMFIGLVIVFAFLGGLRALFG